MLFSKKKHFCNNCLFCTKNKQKKLIGQKLRNLNLFVVFCKMPPTHQTTPPPLKGGNTILVYW